MIEAMIGETTEIVWAVAVPSVASWVGMTYFVTAKTRRPTVHDSRAASGPERLNVGSMPRSIGIATGPTSAPNHVMMRPSTPPNESDVSAMAIDRTMNSTVETRPAMSSVRAASCPRPRRRAGMMSRTTTEEMALASDDVMAMVCENMPARTRPMRPAGSRVVASSAYDWSGLARPGRMIGAAHIGKKRMRGQMR